LTLAVASRRVRLYGQHRYHDRLFGLRCFGGLVVSLFAYVGYQKSRDRQRAIRKAFDDVIEFLALNNEEHRLAGAILLRRFFDKKSEFGLRTWWWPIKKRAPYAQEAITVTAAVLRGTETCNFQKLLADGLAYAHDLKDVDLQKTNLQNAYLSTERKDKRFNWGELISTGRTSDAHRSRGPSSLEGSFIRLFCARLSSREPISPGPISPEPFSPGPSLKERS